MVIWKRKLYRIVIGSLFPVSYLISANIFLPLFLASFFLTLVLALEYERYVHPAVWSFLLGRFGVFKKATGSFIGETHFMIACFFALLVFSRPVAIAALFFLTFGDAGSALAGTWWGQTSLFGNKTVEGLIGGLASNALVSLCLSFVLPLHGLTLISGFLLAGILESLPLKLDDNLTVGFIPGFLMSLLELLLR